MLANVDNLNNNFWIPAKVNSGQIKNCFRKALIAIGEFADSYVSLSSKKVLWSAKEQEVITSISHKTIEEDFTTKAIVWNKETITDRSKFGTFIKVLKIASYCFGITFLLGLCIKATYKKAYIPQYIHSKLPLDRSELIFNVQEKRTLLAQLPKWIEDHYEEEDAKALRRILKEMYIENVGNISDDEISDHYKNLKDTIIDLLSNDWYSSPAMLRGLYLPAEKNLKLVTEEIIHEAWAKIVRTQEDHRAWCYCHNIMSEDSFTILSEVLEKEPKHISEKATTLGRLNNVILYEKPRFTMAGPALVFNVWAPK